ncbi:MAG TPA: hypothetical protein VD713_03885, partial [Sphingomonadales bacterium]|nr:hypothetical protein [Sphingomonadales bacterium]
AAVASLARAGALPAQVSETLTKARQKLAQTYSLLRLCWPERRPGEALPEPLLHLLGDAMGVRAEDVEAALRETEAVISALYQQTFARYGESGRADT